MNDDRPFFGDHPNGIYYFWCKTRSKMTMKYLLLFFCLAGLCFACKNTPATGSAQAETDLEAISATIHGFYAWYDAFQIDQSRNVLFFDDSGEHLQLDSAKLEQYYNNLRAGGFAAPL